MFWDPEMHLWIKDDIHQEMGPVEASWEVHVIGRHS